MKIYIDTTADPKNALIAGQSDNQAATMQTLFYGDVLPFQVMFTDGSGNPAEFSGQANNEVIFAIGILIPHQTYAKTQVMAFANNTFYADLDLNTIGLENALAGNESVNLTFEIQRKNGMGQSTTLAQGDCTVRNQLNLFSAINSTLPDAPSAVNATDSTPGTVPAAPSTIQISQTTTDGQLLILQDFTYGGFSGTAGQIIEVLSWVGQRPLVAKSNGQELLPVSLKNTHWEIYAQNVLIPSNPSNINILENKPYIVYGNDGTNGLGYYYPVYLYEFGLSQYHTHNFGDRIVTEVWQSQEGNTSIIGEFLKVLQTTDTGARQYERADGSTIWSGEYAYINYTIAAQNYYMENTAVNHAATYPTNTDLENAPGTQLETFANAPSQITVLSVFSNNDIGREITLLPNSGLLNISWATLEIGNIYITTNVDTNNNRIGFLDDNETFVWIDDATKAYGRQLGVDWEFYESEIETVPAAPGVPTVQELISSPTITHEGNTYTLEDDSSTLNISYDVSRGTKVTRQNDLGENVITFTSGALTNTYGGGPEITIPKIHANAHWVGIDLKEGTEGSDYIITRGSGIFNNGVATDEPFYLFMHTQNLIENSTTRSKTILRLTYRTITNQILDTKYYKIGFEEIETVPAAPGQIAVLIETENQTPSTMLVYHGDGGVLNSSLRSQTYVSTNSLEWTDIYGMTYGDGNYYRVHIPLPNIANTAQFAVTLTNETTGNNSGLFDVVIGNNFGLNYDYNIIDGTNDVSALRGRTVIRINWLDENNNPLVNEAVLRLNLVDP